MSFRKLLTLLTVSTVIFAVSGFGFEDYHSIGQGKDPKLNYDSLFSNAAVLSDSEAGQTLVANCIKAYGGVEKLKQLTSLKLSYNMKPLMTPHEIEVTKFIAADRRYRIDRKDIVGTEQRILNGDEAWIIRPDTNLFLYSGRYKAELFSYLTLSMPLAIKTEPYNEMRYGQRENDSLSYLYLKKNDSLMIVIGIDPENNLIKQSEGIIYQDSSSFVFINRFSEFSDDSGYMLPYKMVNISMGLEVGQSSLTSVVINPGFEAAEFKPPVDTVKKDN